MIKTFQDSLDELKRKDTKDIEDNNNSISIQEINELLQNIKKEGKSIKDISDGYHTFDELYEHRHRLYIMLCAVLSSIDNGSCVWRSKSHSDGSMFDDMFIMGINKDKDHQITYHLPMEKWDYTHYAETLEKAPEFDGHTPDDVLERLFKFLDF